MLQVQLIVQHFVVYLCHWVSARRRRDNFVMNSVQIHMKQKWDSFRLEYERFDLQSKVAFRKFGFPEEV